MVRLCSDRDILKYEPALFGVSFPANQVIAAGTNGVLAGTTFGANGVNFVLAQVESGDCIYLKSADGKLDGVYEIVAVDSATQVCVSVLRADSQSNPIAPPAGTQVTGVTYRVSTYKPQIADVSLRLMEYLWIKPGEARSDINADEILNSDEVRQLCAMGTIATVYWMMAAGPDDTNLWSKAQHYEQLFGNGMERCRVAIDKDGDGVVDGVRYGGCGRLFRE
jgi:hypothetical protein